MNARTERERERERESGTAKGKQLHLRAWVATHAEGEAGRLSLCK